MSKNRSMQAKNAKAKKWAIAETAAHQCYQIQYEGVLSRNNKGRVSWIDQRTVRINAMAERCANALVKDKNMSLWFNCYDKAVRILELGMSEQFVINCLSA